MDFTKKSSRNISPECHLEQWKSVFLGAGIKKIVRKVAP
jgi:hypothetical protein